MAEILYCYKVDELTGQITQYEIKNYDFQEAAYGNKNHDTWSFRGIVSKDYNYRYCIERFKLDRYVSQKVFTFNSSKEYAHNIIRTAIRGKINKAQYEQQKYNELLNKIEMSN